MSKTTNKFSPEVRERAVRMVLDYERDHPMFRDMKHEEQNITQIQ